ncbi:ABC transporter related protein (fragment) [Pseudolactococcus piscium]
MIMLTIKDLSFRYNDHYVLKNCNLQVNAGDIVGLIGDNGAGKTTLMKLISGILPDYTGDITVNSETIGVLIENPTLYPNMTVLSNLHFFVTYIIDLRGL